MSHKAASEILAIRVGKGGVEEYFDTVATEFSYSLMVNGEALLSLRCSPVDLEPLAVGFLVAEGLVTSVEQVEEVAVDDELFEISVRLPHLGHEWRRRFSGRTLTSGCGYGVTFSDGGRLQDFIGVSTMFSLPAGRVRKLLADFMERSRLFRQTGGVHGAAVVKGGEIVVFCEDIGRHNAVDKAVGRAILGRIGLDDAMLVSSGRLSGEIVTKVVRAGIPVVLSRAAPTCMALQFAEYHGVTLIGFARAGRMNIYTHPQRIVLA